MTIFLLDTVLGLRTDLETKAPRAPATISVIIGQEGDSGLGTNVVIWSSNFAPKSGYLSDLDFYPEKQTSIYLGILSAQFLINKVAAIMSHRDFGT